MQKEGAEPKPTSSPSLSVQELCFPFFQQLTLEDRTNSISEKDHTQNSVSTPKKKLIVKGRGPKKYTQKQKPTKTFQRNRKKVQKLENVIKELELENDKLKRKIECCSSCNRYMSDDNSINNVHKPHHLLTNLNNTDNCQQTPKPDRDSYGSLEFDNIDFHATLLDKQMDDKAWVFLGTVMIAMGSKCLDVDGTINVFKILKQSVDKLRRQVEKSETHINLDFFISKEQMQEDPFMQEIGFDPFTPKIQQSFCLEGVKMESVEQFQLTYDTKLTYNLKYQALLGAMEYIRENSWLST